VTAAAALRAATARLTAAGIDNAAGDARLLLAHAMAIAPDRLILHLPDALTDNAAATFEDAMVARLARQPVSQIVGGRDFWGRRFIVTPDVLDPRPDTEALIADALTAPFTRVLDLGTGSGAILLTLLAERGGTMGQGVDLSAPALDVARRNAEHLGLAARVDLRASDWFGAVTGDFDLIVANPPYISADEMLGLAPEVRDWEPHLALTPGGDGLDPYRIIAAQAPRHLRPGGRLIVEIGPTQGQAVAAMFRAAGLRAVAVLPDLDRRDRVVRAQQC
tara:strand:- start:794 stop:1624 length:831 start_codon:yes stop_codon:yes gene_type:complete